MSAANVPTPIGTPVEPNPTMAKQFVEMLKNADPVTRAQIGQLLGFSPTRREQPRDRNAEAANYVRAFGAIVRKKNFLPEPPEGIAALDPGYRKATVDSPMYYTPGSAVDRWLRAWQDGKLLHADNISMDMAYEEQELLNVDAEELAMSVR